MALTETRMGFKVLLHHGGKKSLGEALTSCLLKPKHHFRRSSFFLYFAHTHHILHLHKLSLSGYWPVGSRRGSAFRHRCLWPPRSMTKPRDFTTLPYANSKGALLSFLSFHPLYSCGPPMTYFRKPCKEAFFLVAHDLGEAVQEQVSWTPINCFGEGGIKSCHNSHACILIPRGEYNVRGELPSNRSFQRKRKCANHFSTPLVYCRDSLIVSHCMKPAL